MLRLGMASLRDQAGSLGSRPGGDGGWPLPSLGADGQLPPPPGTRADLAELMGEGACLARAYAWISSQDVQQERSRRGQLDRGWCAARHEWVGGRGSAADGSPGPAQADSDQCQGQSAGPAV